MSEKNIPERTLDSLALGEKARIARVHVQGQERRRLMDLGFLPGVEVEPALNNPLGDPRGFQVLGTLVALRKQQAQLIEVEIPESQRIEE